MIRAVAEAWRGLRQLGASVGTKGASSPVLEAWLRGADTLPQGLDTIRAPYNQHPTIYRAINAGARAIGRVELKVHQAGDQAAEVDNHWLPELTRDPGQGRHGNQLVQAVVISMKLRGEAFLWHKDLGRGTAMAPSRPMALWMLHPLSMEPLKRDGEVYAWRWTGSMGVKTIPVEELTFLKYENPEDPDRGLGPIQAAILDYTSDHRAASWNRAFFDNSALPPMVFVPKGNRKWDEKERKRYLKAWEGRHRGTRNAGKPAALPFEVDVKELKFTQQEMDYLKGREFSRENILSALGTPPFLAGIMRYANYANTGNQEKTWWLDNLVPDMEDLAAGFTYDLLRKYEDGTACRFDYEPILAEITAEEFAKKVETAAKLWGMGWPADAIADRMAMKLKADTTEYPHLAMGFLPSSVVPADDLVADDDEEEPQEVPPIAPPPPPAEPEEDPDEEEARQVLELLRKLRKGDDAPTLEQREREVLYSGYARQFGGRAKAYGRSLRSWMLGLRRETMKSLDTVAASAGVKGQKQEDEEDLAAAAGMNPEELADHVTFQDEPAKTSLVTRSTPFLVGALVAGGEGVVAEAGLALDFDHLDPEVQTVLASKKVKLVNVANTVRQDVRAAVIAGAEAGEGVNAMGRRIRRTFQTSRARSLTIARTETAQAFSAGRYHAMKQNRVEEIEWVSSRDDRVRQTHLNMDGRRVPLGTMFPNGCKYPSDPEGPAGEVINCRCQHRPVRRRRS